ncbi:phosphotransferase [Amylibacter sp.]|nr:phosphotransferase [Amylibacter sp.]
MKLDELLQRENFQDIFSKTLKGYLIKKKQWNGDIFWGVKPSRKALNLFVNRRTNIIFPTNLNSVDIRTFAAEYSYNKNIFLRVAQSLYVYLSSSKLFREAFISDMLSIQPCPEGFSDICILPGNHSIRIINLKLHNCIVLLKLGYRSDKLKNAINIRTSYPDLPGPAINSWSFDEGWYQEDRIVGLPIDRVSSCNDRTIALAAAYSFLTKLRKDTNKKVSTTHWAHNKSKEIDIALDLLPDCYGNKIRNRVNALKLWLLEVVTSYPLSNKELDISTTHGDFQPANILVPSPTVKENVYLIDWEYSGVRCSHYDLCVYHLNARSPAGLAKRAGLLFGDAASLAEVIASIGLNQEVASDKNFLLLTFLIEELLFRLNDSNVPNLKKPSCGLKIFLDETKLIQLDIARERIQE